MAALFAMKVVALVLGAVVLLCLAFVALLVALAGVARVIWVMRLFQRSGFTLR